MYKSSVMFNTYFSEQAQKRKQPDSDDDLTSRATPPPQVPLRKHSTSSSSSSAGKHKRESPPPLKKTKCKSSHLSVFIQVIIKYHVVKISSISWQGTTFEDSGFPVLMWDQSLPWLVHGVSEVDEHVNKHWSYFPVYPTPGNLFWSRVHVPELSSSYM